MEIERLRFIATEDDLNRLFSRVLTPPPKFCHLHIKVIPPGLLVSGNYETILSVPFKCLWKLSVIDGKIVAELSDIKCVGIRFNLLERYVLNALISTCNVFELRDESIFLDLDRVLRLKTGPIQTNLTSIRCEVGKVIIECGNSH